MKVCLDRRQGDVHDRRVEHDHELAEAHDDESEPRIEVRVCAPVHPIDTSGVLAPVNVTLVTLGQSPRGADCLLDAGLDLRDVARSLLQAVGMGRADLCRPGRLLGGALLESALGRVAQA